MWRGSMKASKLACAMEPVITALLAVLLLGESLGLAQLVGGALIVVAVLIVARVDAPRLEPSEPRRGAGRAGGELEASARPAPSTGRPARARPGT